MREVPVPPAPSVPRAQFKMVSASLRSHTPISHWASGSLYPALRALTSAPTGDMSLHSESQDEIRKRIPKLFSSFRAHAVKVKIGRADFAIINGKAADDGFKQGDYPLHPSYRVFLQQDRAETPVRGFAFSSD